MKIISGIYLSIVVGLVSWSFFTPIDPQPVTSLPAPAVVDTDTVDTLNWQRPQFSERQDERNRMVREGVQKQGISDPKVLEAMRHVPRHFFVPKNYQDYAYLNRPLPIGYDQTISQPLIVGYMTQMLDLETGEKVLEVGTGSGYQAAVLAQITPYVYTIEIVKPLAEQAIARFKKLNYSTIKTKIGDGYEGWEEYAPFDAIILTAAPEEIPQPLIDQLKTGGVLVAPVGTTSGVQMLKKLTKSQNGKIRTESKMPVRFVPMTGEAEGQ